jgi:hypothetical protein
MTHDLRQLTDRAHHHDIPTFLQTCRDLGGYPEPPAWAVRTRAGDGDTLQNLARWARTGGGEGRA